MSGLEKKELSEEEMGVIIHELITLQGEVISKGRQNQEWQLDRGCIDYDQNEKEIKSWGNGVKVDYIDDRLCQLEGLGLGLTLQEGLWLANFKNWLKHKYPNEKVEFKQDMINKNLAPRKTLCVNDTMLITRNDLIQHIRLCKYDRNMETLTEWLNN